MLSCPLGNCKVTWVSFVCSGCSSEWYKANGTANVQFENKGNTIWFNPIHQTHTKTTGQCQSWSHCECQSSQTLLSPPAPEGKMSFYRLNTPLHLPASRYVCLLAEGISVAKDWRLMLCGLNKNNCVYTSTINTSSCQSLRCTMWLPPLSLLVLFHMKRRWMK